MLLRPAHCAYTREAVRSGWKPTNIMSLNGLLNSMLFIVVSYPSTWGLVDTMVYFIFVLTGRLLVGSNALASSTPCLYTRGCLVGLEDLP